MGLRLLTAVGACPLCSLDYYFQPGTMDLG